jgi:hypothetical protein
MSDTVRPDVERELSKLKDFQRDTVEYVFDRMYHSIAPTRRFLVADEVGLGKTLVARGVIAKAIEHLWDSVNRIDVVYICSNGSIARQNITRINVSEAKDAALPSRITLLPTAVRGLKERKLNFISLTPQTSFDLRSNLGRYEERALLYHLLPSTWRQGVADIAIQNLFQGGVERDRFRRRLKEFDRTTIDEELKDEFHGQISGDTALQADFATACERFQSWRQNLPDEDAAIQRQIVGRLRVDLATSCLKALQPDLIILDEFQRFKHLLDGTDQASELAQRLFNFGDARVLLLSATPYKMYTIAEEMENDDHFRDFLQTVSFLQANPQKTRTFKSSLDGYRDGLFALGTDGAFTLDSSRQAVERDLREVMVRTERLAASVDRNGMLREVVPSLPLLPDDVATYLAYAHVASTVEHGDITEYWKSAPFLFNFMDEYQLKATFTDAVMRPKPITAIRDALASCPRALLDWDDVERYRALDPANARLRHLISDVIGSGAWRLLWLPPSLPYYRLSGVFADVEAAALTKRLIFSSWQVVPKVVAAVLSYEAERQMFGPQAGVERPNSTEARERFAALLRFPRGEASGAMTLMYPSITLADVGDPLDVVRGEEAIPSAEHVIGDLVERLRPILVDLSSDHAAPGLVDESWYWAAPALLDARRHPDETRKWFGQTNLPSLWRDPEGAAIEDEAGANDGWAEHVDKLARAASGQIQLGRQPEDLPEVLAKVALAAPGVVALRALSRICGGKVALSDPSIRNSAGWIGWSFRSLFNLPEVTAMVRRESARERYWESVLDYCVDGGLQSVMDEFFHVAQEHEGVAYRPYREAARAVARRAASTLQLRTATLGVDAISVDEHGVHIADKRMRARFAARFGAQQTDEGAGAVRADDVRAAFNSPFWPFVLCSTSVGQEGLDFHLYCHAVVHWNLPSNPVDLEQREGRVHRFKGHAIRKNVALLYGGDALAKDGDDPWDAAFQTATEQRSEAFSELVPYWILPAEGGARIERHVPALPLSRDVERADALRKTLTVYRMAFGQNRQDDIVAYLLSRFPSEEIEELSKRLRINLAPDRTSGHSLSGPSAVRSFGVEDHEQEPTSNGKGVRIALQAAKSLLDDYASRRMVLEHKGIEHYRDLLDRFTALNG